MFTPDHQLVYLLAGQSTVLLKAGRSFHPPSSSRNTYIFIVNIPGITNLFVLDSSPWQVAKGSLQHQDKRHPLVVAVEHVLLILAAEPGSNAAAVQPGVVQIGVILCGQGVRLLHEAIRLENLDDNSLQQRDCLVI